MKTNTYIAIGEELDRARKKFPRNQHQFTALVEEVGELGEALMQNGNSGAGHADVRKEAIQVAAMAIRLIEEGDAAHGYDPDSPPEADTPS